MKKNYMYVGPTAAKLGLVRSTLVLAEEGQMLPQLVSLVNTKPMIRALFVATDKVAVARKNMQREGTIEHIASLEISKLNQQLRASKPERM